MEDVLHGYDVLTSAVHLTASTLALLGPNIAFHKTNLNIVPFGSDAGGQLHLGSLDFMDQRTLVTSLSLMNSSSSASVVSGAGTTSGTASVPDLDLCVMNPPFTRSVGGNLLFGSLPATERKAMQRHLTQRMARLAKAGRPLAASVTAGLGSLFVAIADRYLKPGGRMALVLPAGVSTGASWAKARQLFAGGYVVEFLISSHDATRWSFSESTNMSEALIIARKDSSMTSQRTRCINLWRNAATATESLALADSIAKTCAVDIENQQGSLSEIMLGSQKWGEAITIDWNDLRTAQWYGTAFAQTELARTAYWLRRGELYLNPNIARTKLPLAKLTDFATLGPDVRDITDGFALAQSPTAYPAVQGHNTKKIQAMQQEADVYLNPRTQQTQKANRPLLSGPHLWDRAGNLFIAERLRLDSQRLMAILLPTKALAKSSWWPTALDDNGDLRWAKALCLWLNSTLGIVSFGSQRVPTEGAWGKLKTPDLLHMLVLDPRKLSDTRLSALSNDFDRLANVQLSPFSEMDRDKTRAKIDAALQNALGFSTLDSLRSKVSKEPFVCGRSIT